MKIPHPCLVLLLAAASSLSANEWVLTYEFNETRDIASPDGKIPPRHETTAHPLTIALGRTYLAVQDDEQKSIYDFAGARLVRFSLAKATFQDRPLCSMVDFLDMELLNRRMLAGAMRAAKLEPGKNPFNDYDSETSTHVVIHRGPPAAAARIESRPAAGATEFLHDGAVVVSFTPGETVLPEEFRPRFMNFLAFHCAIHPEIRRAIAATGRAPRELVFHSHYLNTTTVTTLHLVASRRMESDSAKLGPEAKPAYADGAVEQVLAGVRAAAAGQRATRAQAVARADEAVKAKHPLDALLALLEYTLQSGEPMTPELQRLKPALQSDPACQLYLKATDQSSKAACEQGLAANAKIDRAGLRETHMLDLQRANLLSLTGKGREAVPLLLNVLRANPAHAGALHDLGMLLVQGFEHPLAWECFDCARQLYPHHPMLGDIARRERQLQVEQPDFF